MAEAPVTIERQQDGRHFVKDAAGSVLGKHNSPWSAARQLHEYFGGGAGPAAATGTGPLEPGDVEPARVAMEAKRVGGKQSAIMEHPKVPRPERARSRGGERPKIPKP